VTWVLRAHYIGNTFFDAGASAFIAPGLVERAHAGKARPSAEEEEEGQEQGAAPHEYYKVKDIRTIHGSQRAEDATPEAVHAPHGDGNDDHAGGDTEERVTGGALGPEWVTKTAFGRTARAARKGAGKLTMEFGTHVIAVRGRHDSEWIMCDATEEEKMLTPPDVSFEQFPFALWVSNGKVVECDFMVRHNTLAFTDVDEHRPLIGHLPSRSLPLESCLRLLSPATSSSERRTAGCA
jgi:hypothetical protein